MQPTYTCHLVPHDARANGGGRAVLRQTCTSAAISAPGRPPAMSVFARAALKPLPPPPPTPNSSLNDGGLLRPPACPTTATAPQSDGATERVTRLKRDEVGDVGSYWRRGPRGPVPFANPNSCSFLLLLPPIATPLGSGRIAAEGPRAQLPSPA